MSELFAVDLILAYTNAALILLAICFEAINAIKDRQRKQALFVVRLIGVVALLIGAFIYADTLLTGQLPPLSPLRVANTLILFYVDIRGLYDVLSR